MANVEKRLAQNVPGDFFVDSSCIDCDACLPECPVEAIFHEDNVPEEWKPFTQLNAEMASQCPVITEKKEPLVQE